jgi:hypothetical protein
MITYATAAGNVKLELYRDLSEGRGGGEWELVLEQEDEGGWVRGETCNVSGPNGIIRASGFNFLRNTGNISSMYKRMSVREIAVPYPDAKGLNYQVAQDRQPGSTMLTLTGSIYRPSLILMSLFPPLTGPLPPCNRVSATNHWWRFPGY